MSPERKDGKLTIKCFTCEGEGKECGWVRVGECRDCAGTGRRVLDLNGMKSFARLFEERSCLHQLSRLDQNEFFQKFPPRAVIALINAALKESTRG